MKEGHEFASTEGAPQCCAAQREGRLLPNIGGVPGCP